MLSLKERLAAHDRETQAAAAAAVAAAAATQVPSTPATATIPTPPATVRAESPCECPPESCASSTVSDEPVSDPPPSSPASSLDVPPPKCRKNEHLAVTIPRNLWKPDGSVKRCDKYACPVKFSLFERRHHCRKCGGIYCNACSTRTTPLLDTTRLAFLFPPKNTPITAFAAPNAPIVDVRVCDECYNQLHGLPTPRTRPSSSTPSSPRIAARALADSSSSLSTLSPATPPDGRPLLPRAQSALEVAYAMPDALISPVTSKKHHPYYTPPPPVKTTKLEGDLDRYPLKDPSATCKAAGGGRWEPKRYAPRWDGRLPDGRIRYEVEVEKLEEAKARRRANPVIIDGEIRVRKLRAPPAPERGGPYKLPTF